MILDLLFYAKAWYKYSGDIFADIKKCLTADGYSGEYFTNSDCMAVILHRYEDLVEGQTGRITDIIFEIRPSNCWKYGYITKDSPAFLTNNKEVVPDYNLDEAILRYCLSQFCNMEEKYSKCAEYTHGNHKSFGAVISTKMFYHRKSKYLDCNRSKYH